MPFEYAWEEIKICADEIEVEVFLDGQKSRLIEKSQYEACTVSVPNIDRHNMRYVQVRCNSSVCKSVSAECGGVTCGWYLQLRACQATGITKIFQHGCHLASAASPTNGKLKLQMERFVLEKTKLKLKPGQILNALIDDFKLTDVTHLLPKVQALSSYYRRTGVEDNNFLDEMVQLAISHKFVADVDELAAFLYGFLLNENGTPKIGCGSTQDPLLIGCTTKAMLRRLDRASEYPLHVDGTFKLSSFGYPVIVIGVSDYARQFHPVAFFLTPHLNHTQYERALQSTVNMRLEVTGEPTSVRMFMADAGLAERVACEAVDLDGDRPAYKMCWFHVMKSVKKHSRKLSEPSKRLIYHHMYRMHYLRSQADFEMRKEAALLAWSEVPECQTVANHILSQWLTGRFTEWQCFTSPPGFAKTNNPLETFNATIKREYTNHDLVTLNCLLQLLMACAKHRSVRVEPFVTKPRPSDEMICRYKALVKDGALIVTPPCARRVLCSPFTLNSKT